MLGYKPALESKLPQADKHEVVELTLHRPIGSKLGTRKRDKWGQG